MSQQQQPNQVQQQPNQQGAPPQPGQALNHPFVRSPNPGGRMMSPSHGGGVVYGGPSRMGGSPRPHMGGYGGGPPPPPPPPPPGGPMMSGGMGGEGEEMGGGQPQQGTVPHAGTPTSIGNQQGPQGPQGPPNNQQQPSQQQQQPSQQQPQQPQQQSANPQQQQQQGPPPQQAKEINTATVCRIGQETVQEIVSRIQDVFSYLKSLQPPVGSNIQERDRQTLEKQQRLQEVLKGIVQLFKRLKVCWEKCQENTLGMEYTQMEALIPIKDERDIKAELEKKRGESYKQALDEHNELSQQLVMRNRHIKEIIDQMRNIIWEINTMLAMRD